LTDFHWQPWFAWRPVTVPGPRPGTRAFIWFETIERRCVIEGRTERWQYRDPEFATE
jgi:hypothetical protein